MTRNTLTEQQKARIVTRMHRGWDGANRAIYRLVADCGCEYLDQREPVLICPCKIDGCASAEAFRIASQTTEECSAVETYTDADGVVWERRWVMTRPGMQQLCWCTTAPASVTN